MKNYGIVLFLASATINQLQAMDNAQIHVSTNLPSEDGCYEEHEARVKRARTEKSPAAESTPENTQEKRAEQNLLVTTKSFTFLKLFKTLPQLIAYYRNPSVWLRLLNSYPQEPITLQAVPNELVTHIMSFADPETLHALAQTAKRYHALAEEWRNSITINEITTENLLNLYQSTELTITRQGIEALTVDQILLINERFPYLTHLTVANLDLSSREIKALARNFKNLVYLDASKNTVNDVLEDLAESIFADQLTYLDLSYNSTITNTNLKTVFSVARNFIFKKLKHLNLSHNPAIDTFGFYYISCADFAQQLITLNLANTGITHLTCNLRHGEQETHYKILDTFKNLENLDLSNNPIKDRGLSRITASSCAAHLVALSLENTGITEQGIADLSRIDSIFPRLKKLSLSNNKKIKNEGLFRLSLAPFAQQLTHLSLANTTINSFYYLKSFTNLEYLDVAHNCSDLSPLANASFASKLTYLNISGMINCHLLLHNFKNLTKLVISNGGLNDDSLEILSRATFVSQLILLDIKNSDTDLQPACPHQNTFSQEGLKHLYKFTALKQLILQKNKINNSGLQILSLAPFAQRLQYLDIRNNSITRAALPSIAHFLNAEIGWRI